MTFFLLWQLGRSIGLKGNALCRSSFALRLFVRYDSFADGFEELWPPLGRERPLQHYLGTVLPRVPRQQRLIENVQTGGVEARELQSTKDETAKFLCVHTTQSG